MSERLQKILARAGYGSRRTCEEYIREGRVTVNGRVAGLGDRGEIGLDDIRLDGVPVRAQEDLVYVALHKPKGVESSSRSQSKRPAVVDLVPLPQRLYPAGRLDADSEGLILLTNDGALTHKLTHPSFGHEKEYRVQLDKSPSAAQLRAWREGVDLSGGVRTLPARVWREDEGQELNWIGIVLRQGRKRQIRETAARLGLRVRRLIRVRIAGIRLGDLPSGSWRKLTPTEIAQLREQALGERQPAG